MTPQLGEGNHRNKGQGTRQGTRKGKKGSWFTFEFCGVWKSGIEVAEEADGWYLLCNVSLNFQQALFCTVAVGMKLDKF
ncbi:hypothetical protein FRX31_002116 [Thalictrum thalictroides]|uniref:Uncharacterized protein n=1 Tax=Thalictrum thalictroides TaxID=46969 RepID=A0A7J6XFJ4_THATH|nr:hypothetical protein FRX31_002116 [Thalictrum thalictroides]